MGVHSEYSCSECGYRLVDSTNIFWIDVDKNIHVDILTVEASNEASKALVSGGIYKYYCYNCKKHIYNFHINNKSVYMSKDEIIELIEKLDDNTKTIDFDSRYQNCLECENELLLKMEKTFALDADGEFFIENPEDVDFSQKQLDFHGKYYGYYCPDCSKQINKFVIFENNAELSDELLKEILKDHTNDLTVFINDSIAHCPECGSELHVLAESSACPKCADGRLVLENQTFID